MATGTVQLRMFLAVTFIIDPTSKSKHNDVIFTFTSKKEFYKTINKNVIEPLDDNFKTASGNKQPTSPRTSSISTANRFDALSAPSYAEAASS